METIISAHKMSLKENCKEEALIYLLRSQSECEPNDFITPLILSDMIEDLNISFCEPIEMEKTEMRTVTPIPISFSPTTFTSPSDSQSNSNSHRSSRPISDSSNSESDSDNNSTTNNQKSSNHAHHPPLISPPDPAISSNDYTRKAESLHRFTSSTRSLRPKHLESTPPPFFQTALQSMGSNAPPPADEKKQLEQDERLKMIEPRLIEVILNEVLQTNTQTTWSDLAGLDSAKFAVKEAAIDPMLYPELFTGLREPSRGVLFFGPPGTGKTMIAKALATEAHCTFFNISAASLVSKWIGEGEKITRALFAVARAKAPAIIFIDEIDSILTKRSESDLDGTRRVKTEFLQQFDGIGCGGERVLVLGATNRPQDLDDAARRRFTKRIYIPLPDDETRRELFKLLLSRCENNVTLEEVEECVIKTKGYSCADIANLCKEAAMISARIAIRNFRKDKSLEGPKALPMSFQDLISAAKSVTPSVSPESINAYVEWDNEFGYHPQSLE